MATSNTVKAVRAYHFPYQARIKVAIALLFLWLVPFFLLTAPSFEQAVVCIFATVVTLVLLTPFFTKPRYDIFEPMSFVLLSTIMGTTLRAIYIVYTSNDEARNWLMMGRKPEFILTAAPIILLAIILLTAGYMTKAPVLAIRHMRVFRTDEWRMRRFRIVMAVLLLLSAFFMVLYVRRMGIIFVLADLQSLSSKRRFEIEGSRWSASLGYYAWGAKLVIPAFLIYVAWFADQNKRFFSRAGLGLVALGIAGISFPILTSSRSGTLLVVLQSFVVWHYLRGRLPIKAFAIALVGALTLFISLTAIRKSASTTDEVAQYFDIEDIAEYALGNRNMLCVAKTAIIVDAVPETLKYTYGRTYVMWMLAPIPRTMWLNKPAIKSGKEIGQSLFGLQNQSGVPPGMIGEMFINFGIIGVGIAFLFGMMLKSLYRSFAPLLGTKNGVLLYVGFLLQVSFQLIGTDFSSAVAQSAMGVIPMFIALSFITKKQSSADAPSLNGRELVAAGHA